MCLFFCQKHFTSQYMVVKNRKKRENLKSHRSSNCWKDGFLQLFFYHFALFSLKSGNDSYRTFRPNDLSARRADCGIQSNLNLDVTQEAQWKRQEKFDFCYRVQCVCLLPRVYSVSLMYHSCLAHMMLKFNTYGSGFDQITNSEFEQQLSQ